MDLKNKVAIVTGASRGIGRQIALELAKRGANVAIAARTVEAKRSLPGTIGETLDMLEKAGAKAIAVRADVGQHADLERLVAETVEKLGRLDVLVNNAADTQGSSAAVEDYPFESWMHQFATNVHAPFTLMGLAVPHMKKQGGGVIVNITSGAGDMIPFVPNSAQGLIRMGSMVGYASTKAALNRMTNALAPELAAANIAAACVDPGFTKTEFVDLLGARGMVDSNMAHPMDVPVQTVMKIITAADPLTYAGQVVRAAPAPAGA